VLLVNGPNRRQQGYTYLWVLFAVALLGVGLASAGVVWHIAQQREKERELLFIGGEFRDAIARYYNAGPGAIRQYPRELSDLIKDPRYASTQRYLRKIYHDPITGKTEWGIVRSPAGEITGVYSLSQDKPIKVSGFRAAEQSFEGKTSYTDWKFIHSTLPSSAPAQGTSPLPPTSIPTNTSK
jgi:type II secretory pathway pseudopilin PulG